MTGHVRCRRMFLIVSGGVDAHLPGGGPITSLSAPPPQSCSHTFAIFSSNPSHLAVFWGVRVRWFGGGGPFEPLGWRGWGGEWEKGLGGLSTLIAVALALVWPHPTPLAPAATGHAWVPAREHARVQHQRRLRPKRLNNQRSVWPAPLFLDGARVRLGFAVRWIGLACPLHRAGGLVGVSSISSSRRCDGG